MRPRGVTFVAAGAALAGLAAVVVAGLVLAGGGGSAAQEKSRSRSGGDAPRPPRLAGTDALSGEPVSLARLGRKPVVVLVWASWCDECWGEATRLGRFARGRRLAVLGVDTQDTTEDAKAFADRTEWTYPTIADPDGVLAARLGLDALPTTLFLDREHRIVGRIDGRAEAGRLVRGVAQAAGRG